MFLLAHWMENSQDNTNLYIWWSTFSQELLSNFTTQQYSSFYTVPLSFLLSLDLWSIVPPLNSCSYFYIMPFHLVTQFDTIYLNISKAFDSISHSHLLCHFNISGSLWLWLQAYRSNRFQFVSINNCYSNLLSVIPRVPQGSILGSLLFIMFMNDLPNALINSSDLLFADDTKCFRYYYWPTIITEWFKQPFLLEYNV